MTLKDIITGIKFIIKSKRKPPCINITLTDDYSEQSGKSEKPSLKEAASSRNLFIGATVSYNATEEELALATGHFNSVTAENLHKWPHLLKERQGDPLDYDFSRADKVTDWAVKNGMRMRGHTLVWSKMNHTHPKALNRMVSESENPGKMMTGILEKHINRVMGHFKGRITQWDVVNEVFRYGGEGIDGIFMDVLGEKYIDDVFHMAHKADPGAELVINETIGSYRGGKAVEFLDFVKGMLDRGVPVHGIGIQEHNNVKGLDDLAWFIKEVEKTGLFLEITEMDMRANFFRKEPDKYQAQAEALYQRIKTAVDSKCCRGITFWGLHDGNTWMDRIAGPRSHAPNEPQLFDGNLKKKPAYYGVLRAIEEAAER